ncbi:putative ATP-dependent RNA helicase TDRD12 [Anoplophora glabripennis]|nr:putative ATP-dependent RNA helicase TDRD12 [Anoplophora glabripennis]
MEVTTKFVAIPTFVNPHLFWIIEPNSDKRNETLNRINKLLQDECTKREPTLNDSSEIGEIVAVSLDGKLYRAVIEYIPNSETQEKNNLDFLCWLIDYGIMCRTDVIYKLPGPLRKVAPLALQASLNNVAYVKQNLTFDYKSGMAMKTNERVLPHSSVAHQVSLELMLNLSDLQFKVENKVDGIFVGDILYRENQELKSLRQALIDKGILIIEETVFKEIMDNIYSYKEAHLWLLAQICKKLNSVQFLKGTESTPWFEKMISKYLLEFKNNDLFDDDLPRPFFNRRSRSRNSANDSQNSINSGNESMSDIEVPSKSEGSDSSKDKSPMNTRLKTLLEKMKKQKHGEKVERISSSYKLNNSSSSLGTDDDCSSPLKKQPLTEGSPVAEEKKEHFVDKEGDVALSNSDNECINHPTNSVVRKRVVSSNAVFVPGGATFTLLNKKKTAKQTPKDLTASIPKISSDEDLSDCKTKNVVNEHVREESSPGDDTSTTEEIKTHLNDVGNNRVNQLQIKPFCTCKQCDHWTNDNDWSVDTKFLNESKESKHLCINKPQTLFIKDGNQNLADDRTIISLNYSSKTKLQKQSMLKLLVHGEYSQAPVRSLSEVCFHEGIRNSLHQLKYREAKRIQIYTWPAIFRQQHVVMVNGPQTGKTIAYLPVILTFLLEKNERYRQFMSKTNGPIAIVLCANTKKCEEVYDLSKTLLGGNRLKVSLITYPLSHVNTKYTDMLVTTPTILVDLLKQNAINFKRLCHLILEDGDAILKLEPEIMNGIFDLTQSMLSNRIHPKPVQLIICAEHWDLRLENLIRRLNKIPLICIGNYLEAALYGKIQFSMKFVNSACKEHELKSLLKDTFRICKSIILCKEEEIEEIQTILMLKGIDATVVSEHMSKEDILYLEQVWTQCKGGEYTGPFQKGPILGRPSSGRRHELEEAILHEIEEDPNTSIRKIAANHNIRMKCQSVVLCDEKCEEHMPKFFNFINSTELQNQMSDKFKNFSQGLKHLEEEKKLKNEIGLCETLKLFGICSVTHCPWRHIVNKDVDISDYLPQSGKIKFKIVRIHDVTNYSVQLIQHIDMEDNVHEFTDNFDITEELTNVIKISKKQIINPVVGHKYAYYDIDELDGVYYRCDVLEIERNGFVRVKLLDKGNIIRTEQKRLFKLPKEFKNKPRGLTDVYLANFTPPHRDENFSAKSFFNLKNLLEKHDYGNMIMTADIHLQIGNTLWLKNVYEEVTLSEKVIPHFQLTREILMSKLAEYNNNQLNNLYKLCKEASISLPVYQKANAVPAREERKIEPQWAHLDTDVNEVTFSAAISPDEIYVRLNKFNEQLYSLQKEIQASLKKVNYPKLQNVEIGTICLAKDPEGLDYARTVVKIVEDNKALCFFVDFGDEAVVDITDLKYIHNKFITKLPFQSIQCRLQGIKPVLDEWQSDINNILYKYATEPDSDIFRLLFVKICGKEENSINPRQNRYSVLLKDGFGEKNVLINTLLVDCGVAVPNSEQIDDFYISSAHSNSDESDEELEHIIDICRKTKEVEENVHVNGDQSAEKDSVNEDMELFLINAEEFFKSLLIVNNDVKSVSNRELPPIQAAPAVDYCTPEVYWSQTEKYIKIDIKLHDTDQYNLSLTKGTILHFKTVKNEKTYKLNLMLYQKVSSLQHTAMGPQIRATLTKANYVEWPRLTLSKQRARNIHYDVSTITIKEEKSKKILEFPIMSDEEEEPDNNNIDVMYHVVSDIDSDMDADLAEDSD